MRYTYIPGGWYCDALPGGEHATLIPHQHILTHLGKIPFPQGEMTGVLYLRITDVPHFKMIGQAHDDALNNATCLWEDGRWTIREPSNGTSGVIFDRLGEPHIIAPGANVTSQGYRYVEDDGTPTGALVLGDDTILQYGLSEWSHIGFDLFVGQGHDAGDDPLLVYDAATARLLEVPLPDGVRKPCRFIRCHLQGDTVSLAMTTREGALHVWTTLDELRALPLYTPVVDGDGDDDGEKEAPMKKCEVTVDVFTLTPANNLPDGIIAKFHDRENDKGAAVTIWVENGSARMSIDYPGAGSGLRGETGKRRPVR